MQQIETHRINSSVQRLNCNQSMPGFGDV